ncbi:ATP synthase subunit I [Balneola sp. MJW-20]|uniref:ATP synthase subunit I n=1 Tax=Gracilimonas aurantiaca TaxID=3234185 RepID=UPI0038B2CA79
MSHDHFFRNILYSSIFLLIPAALFLFIGTSEGVGVISGVMLSSIFVLSSAWVIKTFSDLRSQTFVKAFFVSMAVRFILVLAGFIFLVQMTKIDEIYFTVSFIISYLCQSVTEMIFLNKLIK